MRSLALPGETPKDNDDLGTMSAWYVFSSLGIYPTYNGSGFLALSSPQFPSATVRIGQYGTRLRMISAISCALGMCGQ